MNLRIFIPCFFFLIMTLLIGCSSKEVMKNHVEEEDLSNPDSISSLVRNKIKASDNNTRKVTFISVPFSGHFNILMKNALRLAQDPKLQINVIITGWENIKVSEENLKKLSQAGVDYQIINDKPLSRSTPISFTFPRVVNLVDKTIAAINDTHLIIYDFFAMEGFFAGKKLGIPAICSIPAIIGPFNPDCNEFRKGLKENEALINKLEKKFHTNVKSKLEMVSECFLLPSGCGNIMWSWPNFIKASDFQLNRHLKNITFIRPEKNRCIENFHIDIKKGQKLIYVSLGTVVPKNLWNNVPEVRPFIRRIYAELIRGFGNKKEYQVVISTGRTPSDIIKNPPSNFHVYEHVPQVAVLKRADLFVTHAGGNSVNEAIDCEVPMVAIPFFGDQHVCALNIEKLKIGRSFLHEREMGKKEVGIKFPLFERESLKKMSCFTKAVMDVLGNQRHKENIKKLKET